MNAEDSGSRVAGRVGVCGEREDKFLIDAARAGDVSAFEVLVERYHPWLVKFCTHHLDGDRHLAQDIVQECLVKLHAAIQRGEHNIAVRPWLSVVARHRCIDEHRRRRPVLADPPESIVEDDDPFDVDPALGRAWRDLTARQREVLHHRELVGLRYDEIAIAMDTTVSAVETMLFRARAALRRNYQRAGGTLLGCGMFGLALMRVVDGEGSAEAVRHVAACSSCDAATATMGGVGALLRGDQIVTSGAQAPELATLVERTWLGVRTPSAAWSRFTGWIQAFPSDAAAMASSAGILAVASVVSLGFANTPGTPSTSSAIAASVSGEQGNVDAEEDPMLAFAFDQPTSTPAGPRLSAPRTTDENDRDRPRLDIGSVGNWPRTWWGAWSQTPESPEEHDFWASDTTGADSSHDDRVPSGSTYQDPSDGQVEESPGANQDDWNQDDWNQDDWNQDDWNQVDGQKPPTATGSPRQGP